MNTSNGPVHTCLKEPSVVDFVEFDPLPPKFIFAKLGQDLAMVYLVSVLSFSKQ